MASAIDPTLPVNDIPAHKADLRANLAAAKSEIEALQGGLAALQNASEEGIFLNVLDFGAVGDDSTLNAEAIQDAIDAAHAVGGGTVFFPPGIYRCETTLNMKRAVRLLGSSAIVPATNHWPVQIRAHGGWSGILLDWPPPEDQSANAAGATGINFRGASQLIPMIGARLRNGPCSYLVSCNFMDFADQAIVVDTNVCLVQDCSCSNTLRGNHRIREVKSGCIEIRAQ